MSTSPFSARLRPSGSACSSPGTYVIVKNGKKSAKTSHHRKIIGLMSRCVSMYVKALWSVRISNGLPQRYSLQYFNASTIPSNSRFVVPYSRCCLLSVLLYNCQILISPPSFSVYRTPPIPNPLASVAIFNTPCS